MEKFNISKRTLHNDFEKINDWLRVQKLPQIEYVRNLGYRLNSVLQEKLPPLLISFKTIEYEFSQKERIAWIYIFIFSLLKKITVQNFEELFHVSRNTILEDVKKLKSHLYESEVGIEYSRNEGYSIIGSEFDQRRVFIHFISQLLTQKNLVWLSVKKTTDLPSEEDTLSYFQHAILNEIAVRSIHTRITQIEQALGVRYTDFFIQQLTIQLTFIKRRIDYGRYVEMNKDEKAVLQRTTEYQTIQVMYQNEFSPMENLQDEVYFLTTLLLGAKVARDIDTPSTEKLHKDLKVVISRMVSDFQKYAFISIENPGEIEKSLYLHLKPTYYRLKYGIQIENELTQEFIQKYTEIYEFTRKVIHHFTDRFHLEMGTQDIVYIAMHFGGWLRREGVLATKQSLIIVCHSGIGTSKLLENQVRDLFPQVELLGTFTVRDYIALKPDSDFVISTIPIEGIDKKVMIVSPLLTQSEIDYLHRILHPHISEGNRRKVSSETILKIIQKHADIKDMEQLMKDLQAYLQQSKDALDSYGLLDLLPLERIQVKDSITDWQEAIQIASRPLLDKGNITPNYVNAMIENVMKLGTYIVIAPLIAIPHAKPEDGVLKIGMSLLKLTEPCSFQGKPVNLIIVLAAPDDSKHLRSLADLNILLSQSTSISEMIHAEQASDIRTIIENYLIKLPVDKENLP